LKSFMDGFGLFTHQFARLTDAMGNVVSVN
jgi:hypothetical protein